MYLLTCNSQVGMFLNESYGEQTHQFRVKSFIEWVETLLFCACVDLLEPGSMIITLSNGGAHLHFRTRDGTLTPLHEAAIHYRK